MPYPSDTSAEAEQILIEVYRRLSPGQKWLQLGEMYRDAKLLHAAGVRLRNPNATPAEIHVAWMDVNLGFKWEGAAMDMTPDNPLPSVRELRVFLRILDRVGLPYALGGSMASSIYGIGRYTRDADITVEPFPGREAALVVAFGPDFYLSLPAIQDALRRRSSFNIINTRTGFKVDFFIRKEQDFERSAFARRVPVSMPDAPEEPVVVHSAEDVVLFKLHWYRLGNELITQQWTDILGVLKVQKDQLDQSYLDRWAKELGVTDLLDRARQEVKS